MNRSKNNVLVGVTGGIACYKTVHLCRLLIKAGYSVKVIMTPAACAFVTPLTFQAITRNRVYTEEFTPGSEPDVIEHIDLAGWADEFIIAPASADTIAKMACGIADNLLTSTVLAYKKSIHIAPSMNVDMLANRVTQRNIAALAALGHDIIDPGVGEMACKAEGKGRLPEPEEIFDHVFNNEKPLTGIKVLVSAGATSEPIDPVRYITNRSSGKMGVALANAAKTLGAEVRLVAGSVSVPTDGLETVRVSTADDMLTAMQNEAGTADILIMAAAVADFKVAEYSDKKIKKTGDEITLRLVKNPDILKELGKDRKDKQIFVGFAAESDDLKKYALKKLNEKNLDMIVANDISRKDIGFESDDNEAMVFVRGGDEHLIGKKTKKALSEDILLMAFELYKVKNGIV